MFVDVETKMNCSIDIDSSEAFRILCKTLNMDFVLDEDTKFLIEKSPEYESRIYTLKNGNKEEYELELTNFETRVMFIRWKSCIHLH